MPSEVKIYKAENNSIGCVTPNEAKFVFQQNIFEEWMDIPEYEGEYQVSNLGRVRSIERKCTIKNGHTRSVSCRIRNQQDRCGYKVVHLKGKTFFVNKLVAFSFVDNRMNFNCVKHIDGNKGNSAYFNLEWYEKIHNPSLPKNVKDLSGQRFGKLNVVEFFHVNKHGRALWLCKCDCGNTSKVVSSRLATGKTKSCGCYRAEVRKNGLYVTKRGLSNRHPLYHIWISMKMRCYNENSKGYHNYGGRGIDICEEWRNNFAAFKDWSMANGYNGFLTIDRINNDLGYFPENCRFSSIVEQNNNKRNNHQITYKGETLNITQWANKLGISKYLLNQRINKSKMPPEIAFSKCDLRGYKYSKIANK